MTNPRAVVLTVSAALAATFGVAALQAHADPTPAAPAASMAPTVLATDVVHNISGLLADTAHVATPAGTSLTLGISVANPDQAAVQSFINATADPTSVDYKHFLTPDEFHARFGPSAATISAVGKWLAGGGLAVHAQPSTYGYLTATGTVSQIGALMKTSFATFPAQDGLIANTVAPTVPAAVLGVAGLNTGTHPRVASNPVHTISKAPGTRADSPPNGLLSPMDLWDIYDQPAADEGQGQGLALFGYGTLDDGQTPDNTVESDMRKFEAEYSLPQIPYYSSYFSATPTEKATETDGFGEWTLDAQAADGMAPKASKLVDYFATLGTDADIVGSYAQWANDPNGPLQGSSSFGDCEDVPGTDPIYSSPAGSVLYLGNPAQDQYAAVYAQAAAEGRTLFAASGDTDACPTVAVAENGLTPVPVPIQDYPGVDTNVVGVGGTVIYFTGHTATTPATRTVEYPWETSGGGQSHFIPAPAEQAAALQPVGTTGSASDPTAGLPVDPYTNLTDHHGNVYSTPMPARIQPDVAALSGDITGDGYTITSDGVNDSFGAGTSLASPLWLGMYARMQAAAPAASDGSYKGLGFALPLIYKMATGATSYLNNFYDDGSASETPPSIPSSNGGTTSLAEGGYDTQTGWGSPDVAHMITTLTGSTTFTPTDPTGGAGVPAADAPKAAPVATPTPTPISQPVTVTALPTHTPTKSTCSVRASSVKISGPSHVLLGRFKSQLYTFTLTVAKGDCKTPSNVGRQLVVYVNGKRAGIIRTGKGGVQKYLVRLKPGTQKITVAFVGNKDLKKSHSLALSARVAL